MVIMTSFRHLLPLLFGLLLSLDGIYGLGTGDVTGGTEDEECGGEDQDDCPPDFFMVPRGFNIGADMIANAISKRLQDLFGRDMRVRPYKETPRAERTVSCDRDLDCDFQSNNGTCRWHNIKNDAGPGFIKDVYVGTGLPNKTGRAMMKNLMYGTDDLPVPGYGIVATQQMNISKIHFCSDPIPFEKQVAGQKGVLTLKHWIMPRSAMTACIRVYDPLNRDSVKDMARRKWPINWLGCSPDLEYLDENAGPSDLVINLDNSYKSLQSLGKKYKKSMAEIRSVKYEVCLLLGPFPLKQGGILMFDDIKYRADYCGGEYNPRRNREKTGRAKERENAKEERNARNQRGKGRKQGKN